MRTCPLLAPVPMNAVGDWTVQLVETSVDPTAWACGAGSGTHPAELALLQPAAPATVQLQISTVCWGRFVVRAPQTVAVDVLVVQVRPS